MGFGKQYYRSDLVFAGVNLGFASILRMPFQLQQKRMDLGSPDMFDRILDIQLKVLLLKDARKAASDSSPQ